LPPSPSCARRALVRSPWSGGLDRLRVLPRVELEVSPRSFCGRPTTLEVAEDAAVGLERFELLTEDAMRNPSAIGSTVRRDGFVACTALAIDRG
jgi:hypothetical protein